jgi:hypothetical protein
VAVDLNHLTLSGWLTRDPLLQTLPSTRRIREPGAEPRRTVEVIAQTIQFAERPA